MKKPIILLIICMYSCITYAQPGVRYAIKLRTPEQQKKFEQIPLWKSVNPQTTPLPVSVDNSQSKYFPEVFNQRSNSCSQASSVRYVFTYEYNRMVDRPANTKENVFSYHFTWNYLNEGKDEGSFNDSGYYLMKKAGAATLSIMDDEDYKVSSTKWLDGYDNYLEALHYRVKECYRFSLKKQEGIDRLRQYLFNHGEEGKTGGIVSFSCNSSDWKLVDYSDSAKTDIRDIIIKNGTDGGHALTICGYDDSVRYDLNNNGIIENDEKGAFIIVNSWGTSWATKGRCYYPYKLFLMPEKEGGITESNASALCVVPEYHVPKVVFHLNLTYDSRDDLAFTLGVSEDEDATEPDITDYYPIMQYQGGDLPMQGRDTYYVDDNKTIDVAMDFTDMLPFFSDYENPKFFLHIRRIVGGKKLGTGKVNCFEVYDYRKDVCYKCSSDKMELNRGELWLSTNPLINVSKNKETWAYDSGEPVFYPFIIRSADGQQHKVQFYQDANHNITIEHKELNYENK